MYNPTVWKDHVTEFPDRRKITNNPDGTSNVVKDQGTIIQQGTPQSSTYFNNLEEGVFAANDMADFLFLQTLQLQRGVQNVAGERGTITLNNTQAWPFNNSGATIALQTPRGTLNYFVQVEVASVTGGAIGDIKISNKLLNGFQIAYDGSAAQVIINYNVTGGAA